MHLHAALITVLNVFVIAIAMGLVGRARGKFQIKAPATTGHPDFERAFRAHQNTLEQTVMFLPVLWLATIYSSQTELVMALGYLWVAARLWYVLAYIREAGKRGLPFLIGALAVTFLLVLSLKAVVLQLWQGG